MISFDLITTSLDPLLTKIIGLSFSIDFNKAFYIPIPYDNKEQSRSLDLNEVLNILTPVFENRKNNFCSQNIKYNCLVLQSHGVSLNNIYFDTMIAAHILHPEKNSYKLDYLSLDYLKYRKKSIEDLIGSGLDQKSMVDIPLDDISFYSCESSDIVLQLTKLLYEE